MRKIIEATNHLAQKKRKELVVPLRGENQGNNRKTNTERPFSILSEEEKYKVLRYCVDQAYEFYSSNNGELG